jgi:hypothetical protein
MAVGNPPAVDLIGKCNQVIALRFGNLTVKGDGSTEASTIGHGNVLIGPSRPSEAIAAIITAVSL